MNLTDPSTGWKITCDQCHSTWPENQDRLKCDCGGLLSIDHSPSIHGGELIELFEQSTSQSGVWRFGAVVQPLAVGNAISHPEGNTPLIGRTGLSSWSGIDQLMFKHEGHNPTGSFKDRGMTVAVTQAVRIGASAVACASTGNTSASLASYAAQAGLQAVVFVPKGQIAVGKMAQALAYGATTLVVDGDFDDCLELAQQAGKELGIHLVNSINPFRIEGQKTIVLEMLRQLKWEAPDWIVVPAGNLGNTAAFGKALREAYSWGLIDKMPRIAAVQASGAAPFATAFSRGFSHLEAVDAETIATAIKIGAPASYLRAVRSIRETKGYVLAVTDAQILEAKAQIDGAGVGCEPASAASLAGARLLRERGAILASDSVVAVLTGHLLKDPGIVEQMHLSTGMISKPNQPIEIAADLGAVAQTLRQDGVGWSAQHCLRQHKPRHGEPCNRP